MFNNNNTKKKVNTTKHRQSNSEFIGSIGKSPISSPTKKKPNKSRITSPYKKVHTLNKKINESQNSKNIQIGNLLASNPFIQRDMEKHKLKNVEITKIAEINHKHETMNFDNFEEFVGDLMKNNEIPLIKADKQNSKKRESFSDKKERIGKLKQEKSLKQLQNFSIVPTETSEDQQSLKRVTSTLSLNKDQSQKLLKVLEEGQNLKQKNTTVLKKDLSVKSLSEKKEVIKAMN